MTRLRTPLAAIVLLFSLAPSSLCARGREVKTIERAADVVQGLSAIPWGMLHEAAGVAIIPRALKAALVLDEEFGRGVVVLHEPDGRWSNPIFVTLRSAGVGGQVGFESTDVVLVFMTRKAVDRALQGRLTLGEDVALAAGPLGRDARIAHEGRLKADIYSYSRSRGLFAGVSLEKAHLRMDASGNKAVYGGRQGSPAEVLAHRGASIAAVETLKARLLGLKGPPNPPGAVIPVVPPPPPPPRRR